MTMPQAEQFLRPGSTIGILGGGQLGRMLALAAARLGFRTHVYCPDPVSPAFDVAAVRTVADYENGFALARFGQQVDVVTYEFENVQVGAARQLAAIVPVRPGARALEVSQDRLAEKAFLAGLGIAVAPYRQVANAADLRVAQSELGGCGILKTRRLGYDGKGQVSLGPDSDSIAAWAAIGGAPAILESLVSFRCEVSIVAVRATDGTVGVYDPAQNVHRAGILHTSAVPAAISTATAAEAARIAGAILSALDYVGVLGVEFFVVDRDGDERLIVNEIAPRVHNSGHWTEDACAVSQFENHIRAIAGWPLGPTSRHADVIMTNLVGEDADAWPAIAAEPAARLHLYGKSEARRGRKMGHVNRIVTPA